ncbi:MAG: glycoside-pentoside-hexuronide (GPH):cation symporter [Oscillospiraceae bacterium]|nr:glycoside-pentoside-hexuronide (GPH):cation symporter [Oscillospiraceae bacterium]
MEDQIQTKEPRGEIKLSFKEKLAYGMGDGSYQLTFSTNYLNMYLTDVLGLALAQVTRLMLLIRIWDGINDPIWGWIVDNSKPGKHGKFRKYLLYAPLPMALTTVLMFTRVPGLTQGQYLFWAYATYLICEALVTVVSVPYGSLIGVISPNAADRTSLSMFRNIGAGMGLMPPAVILPMLVFSKSAEGVNYLDERKHLAAIAALGAIGVLMGLFCFLNTKERLPSAQVQQKLDIKKTARALVRNRPFIVISACSMLLIGTQIYMTTINGYLFKDYFQDPGKLSLYPIAQYASTVLIIPFFTKLVARFGKREIVSAGVLVSALACGALLLIRTADPMVYLALSFFGGVGLSVFTTASWAMVADAIDFQELLSGQREDGIAYSVCSFARKLGHTAAGAGTNVLLAAIGYVVSEANVVVAQTPQVASGMYTIATLVPTVTFTALFLLFVFLYPLGKDKVAELQETIRVRREVAEVV